MTQLIVDIGVQGNDGTGDSIRESFRKVNNNFTELYAIFGAGGTIKFTSLSDAPRSYGSSQVIMSNGTGTALTARNLIAGSGVTIDTTSNASVTISSTSSALINQSNPSLGASLNANLYTIGRLSDPSATLVTQFNLAYASQGIQTTLAQLPVTKGYADSHYVQALNGLVTGAFKPRTQPTTPQISDPDYDATLTSNYVSTEAMQRKDVVYRGGDTMTGALTLSDHPTPLSGAGTPNGATDLQAATKYYVDNNSYSSNINLFVSTTSGDDSQTKTPAGKQGRYWQYAYKTLGAAALQAESLISLSGTEAGPYKQRIAWTSTTGQATQTFSTIQSIQLTGGNSSVTGYQDAADLLEANKIFIQNETIAYLNKKYVNTFTLDTVTYSTIISSILDGVGNDLVLNTTHNSSTVAATLFNTAYNNVLTNQLTQLLDGINYANNIIKTYSYNVTNTQTYIGDVIKAIGYDLLFGSNYQSIQIAVAFGSYNTGLTNTEIISALNNMITTISGLSYVSASPTIVSALNASITVITNILTTSTVPTPKFPSQATTSTGLSNAQTLLLSNISFIQAEIIAYLKSNFPDVIYSSTTCQRDVKLIVQALVYDLMYGGNSQSAYAGLRYWIGNTLQVQASEQSATVAAINYINTLAQAVIISSSPAITYQTSFLQYQNTTLTGGSAASTSISNNIATIAGIVGSASIPSPSVTGPSIPGSGSLYNAYAQLTAAGEVSALESGAITYINTVGTFSIINNDAINTTINNLFSLITTALTNGISSRSATIYTSPSGLDSGYTYARAAALANIQFLSEETYSWSLVNYPAFVPADGVAYFKRHMQYLVEAVCYDITYGGNSASVYAANQYRNSNGSVLSNSELIIQLAAIGHLQNILPLVTTNVAVSPTYSANTQTFNNAWTVGSIASSSINRLFNSMIGYIGSATAITLTNPSLTGYDSSALSARDILITNRSSIVTATNNHLSATYTGGFSYNQATCYRDVGYIIDAMAIDILTGGNYQTVNAGKSYYKNASAKSVAIGTQYSQTTDGIIFAKNLGIQVLNQTTQTRFQSLYTQTFSNGSTTAVTYTAIATGTSITVTFATQSSVPYVTGDVIYLKGFSPSTFNGAWIISNCTTNSITVYSTVSAGSATVMGSVVPVAPSAGSVTLFTGNMTTVLNIINNGLGVVPTVSYGTGIYNINFDNGGNGYVDQGAPGDVHIIPAKILLGVNSGAGGLIVKYLPNNLSGQDTIQIRLTQPGFFQVGEQLDFGETVKNTNITIFVESGIYYEDYPIRLPAQCSIKGDEFRRTIIRPLDRISQSPWRKIFFYRDSVIDANLIGLINYSTDIAPSGVSLTINATSGNIVATLGSGQAQSSWIGKVLVDNASPNPGQAVVTSISGNTLNCTVIYQFASKTTYASGSWHLYGTYDYGRHYLSNPLDINSTALNNKLIDVLLCNDATRISNITFQGHGGFAMVLDPEGQVKTKSPYGQVCSSFSQSTNSKRFAGGQFVDGFAGRLFGNITAVSNSGITITVTGGINSGLDVRAPQVPCVYYIAGNRYQVNDVVSYTQTTNISGNVISGTVVLTIDVGTPFNTTAFYNTATNGTIPSFSADMGNKVDALTYDLVFGSNYQTIKSGLFYLQAANSVIGIQQLFAVAGINQTAILMNSSTGTALAATNATSTGGTATITFAVQGSAPYTVGSTIKITGFTPIAFNGSFTVTNCTNTTVSYALVGTYSQSTLGTVTATVSSASQTTLLANALTVTNILNNGLQAVPTLTFPIPSGTATNTSNAVAILIANKAFIRSEIVAWLASNYSTRAILNYNSVTFSRNFGYFIDAITYDFLYGGNSSVYDNAQGYWSNGVSQILGQEPYYTAALTRLGTVLGQVVQNQIVNISAGNLLTQTTNLTAATSTEATAITNLNKILVDYVADGAFDGVAVGTIRTAPTLPSSGFAQVLADRLIIQNNKTTIQSSAVAFLNAGGNQLINIEMGGNRSMLANDFAMINDLGYAIIATNGAASEQVSTFSYYCHTHYWANNGGQIRSIGGSNAHGDYGMRASGYDVTELPNAVNLAYDMVQVARVYKQGLYASLMAPTANTQALAVYIIGWEYIPPNNAELEIDHTASGGVITRYLVSTISHTAVTINGQNVLQLNLSTAGTNSTVTTGLAYALYDGQQIIIRINQNIKFLNISNVKPTRPSTAVQYSDNLSDIYRIIAYNLTESTGEPFTVGSGIAILQADAGFNYYKFTSDVANLTQLDPQDNTKTQGSRVGDNKIAVLQISLQTTIDQINKGIYITGWGGRTHRVISYTTPTFIATGLYSTYTAVGSVYTLTVTNVSGTISIGQIVTGTGFNGSQTVTRVSISGTSTFTGVVTLSGAASGTPAGTITFGVAANGYITIDPNPVYNNAADGTSVNAMTYASSTAGPTGTSYTAVTFNTPFRSAMPLADSFLTVSGQANSAYNGTYQVLSVVNQTQITVASIAGLSVGMVVTSTSTGAIVQPSTIIQSINAVNNTFTVSPACWLPSGSSVTSTLVATLSGISITNAGTLYTSGIAPTIAITGGGAINQAIATCTVANGSIAVITIVSPGYGYTSTPTITLSYGDGVLTPVLSSSPTTSDIINAGIITSQVQLAYPTAPGNFTAGTTTSVSGFSSLTGSGPYLAALTVTLTSVPAAGTYYLVSNNSNPLYNGYALVSGVYSSNASATSGLNNGVTLSSTTGLTTGMPIQFTASSVQTGTLIATNASGVLTLASTSNLVQGRSIIFTAVTQTDLLTATTATGNYLTLSTVTGLIVGEPIVFTRSTQTPTLTSTSSSGNTLALSSTSGLVLNQPIVFTAVTQNPTIVSTSSNGNVTLSSTTGLTVGSSFIPTAVTSTSATLTSISASGNLATLSSVAGLVQGESIVFTAVSQSSSINTTATAVASATTGIVSNGSINPSAGTIFTPLSGVSGTFAVGMVLTGGALTSTSGVWITTANSALFTGTFAAGTITSVVSSGAGAFTCNVAPTTLYAGMTVTVTGTIGGITWTGYSTGNIYVISTTNGSTSFTLTTTAGAALTVTSGTPTGLTFNVNVLNVSGVSSGALAVGMLITGTSVTTGSYITSLGTGAGGAGTYGLNQTTTGTPTNGTSYTVSISTLQSSTTISGTNNLITLGSTAGMAVGEWFTVASNVSNLASSTNYFITQILSNGTQLAVSSAYGGSNTTLTNLGSLSVLATAGGQMGGVLSGTTYYIASIAGSQITLSTSPTLSPVTTLTQTNSGTSGWSSVAGSVLGGLSSGSTYYVASISSPNITLSSSPTLTPLVTLTNGASGSNSWTSITNSVLGNITSGQTYYIASIASNNITLYSSFGAGAVTVQNGSGFWSSVAGNSLGNVSSGTTYYVATINSLTNQITVTTDAALTNTLTVINAAGSWNGSGGSSFGGLTSGYTYYIATINNAQNQITISTSSTLTPLVSTTQATGAWTAVSGTILGGISSGTIYYVSSINSGSNYVTLASDSGLLNTVTLQTASIAATVNAGPINSITLSYVYNPGTWGIQTSYLSTNSGTVTLSFQTQSNSPGIGAVISVSGFTGTTGYNGTATITAVGTTASSFVGYISGTTLTVTSVSSGTIVAGQYIYGVSTLLTAKTYITGGSGTGGSGTYTINNSQTAGNVSSQLAMTGASSTVSYANATTGAVSAFGQFTTTTSITNETTIGSSSQLGISKPFSSTAAATLRIGYPQGEGAQITQRISTCRATSHDFLQIGTGSYTTTNWPTVIYGNPAKSAQQSQEILEEGVGRVFYVSTDQNGIFRVGRFFTVDQGTGSVTFSASIALSNLDGLGFKRGVVVSEFSTDSGLTNNASDTVSVQSAIRGYIDRRLGLDHGGSPVALTNLIGYGYLSLGGGLAMKGNFNMAGYTISNVGTPTISTDGVNKAYVDAGLSNVGKLSTLTDAQISSLSNAQLLVYDATLAKWRNATATTGDVALSFNSVTKLISSSIATGVIVNSQVSATAAIAQSKLAMNAAGVLASASGITQASLGLAVFDSSQFTSTNGYITHLTSTSAITGIPLSKLQYISNGTILGNLGNSFASPTTYTPSQIVTSAGGIVNGSFANTGVMTVTYSGGNTANNAYSVTSVTSAGGNGASSLLQTGSNKEIDVGYLKIQTYKALYLKADNATLAFTTVGGFDYMTAVGGNASNTTIATFGTLDTSNGTLKSTLFTTGASGTTGQIIGTWQVQASSTWDVTLATLKSLTLDAGSETTAGTVRGNWSLTGASKLQATYADLAEFYEGDQDYEAGSVLVFGGDKEVTTTSMINDTRSAGVVTTNPAYVMNAEQTGIRVCLALAGRVPCKVVGRVKKGDMLTTSATPGYAVKALNPTLGAIIGKALEDKDYGEAGVIQVAVGRI